MSCTTMFRAAAFLAVALSCSATNAAETEGSAGGRTDPFVAAFSDFWPWIQKKCPAPPTGYDIVVIGLAPEDAGFTVGQKVLVAQKIGAALSLAIAGDTGARVAPLAEIGETVALMSAGHSRLEVDEFVREQMKRRNLGIKAEGWTTSQGYEFVLTALGGIGLPCKVTSTTVRLPAEALPEEVMQPDEFMSRAAEHIVQRLDGASPTKVLVRSVLANGAVAPVAWSQSIARALRQGHTLALNRLPTLTLNRTRFDVQATQNLTEAQAWDTEVTVGARSRETARLEVDVKPPAEVAADPLSFKGLVRSDILPPLGDEDLRTASQTGALRSLDLAHGPQAVRFTLGGSDRRRELVFTLAADSALEMDLPEVSGPAPPDLRLLDGSGNDVSTRAVTVASRPNLRRWRLSAGSYSAILDAPRGGESSFVFRARTSDGPLAVEPQGQIMGEAGDWMYGLREEGDGRTCFALTAGTAAPAGGGRLMSPFMLVQSRAGEDAAAMRLDGAGEWSDPGEVTAQVERKGRSERLDVSLAGPPKGQSIVLDKPCRQSSGNCLPQEALYRFANGTRVVLWGPGAKGTGVSVVYSLRGYRAAVYGMATLCGQRDLAEALVLDTQQP